MVWYLVRMIPIQTTLRLFDDETSESGSTENESEMRPDYESTRAAAEHPLEPSRFGGIKLHEVARWPYCAWDYVDPAILTEEVLLSVNGLGFSVAHLLARARFIDQLPAALVTPRVLMTRGGPGNHTVLHDIAWNGGWDSIDQNTLSEEMLLAVDGLGCTVAHRLARREGFAKLAPALITARVLLARGGRHNDTVLHFLTTTSFVGVIPAVSPDMLLAVNDRGTTVLEAVARNLALLREVAGLLTTDMLEMKTAARRTILSYAVQAGCLDLIAPGAFRPEWMRRKFQGRTLLQILAKDYAKFTRAHFTEFHEQISSALLARLIAE
jgi:hypothetical protein